MFSDYIELRARSAFSFLAGASLPEDLVERAASLGYSTLGLGDRDGLYGAPRFHQAAVKAGMRAIIGASVTVQAATLLGGDGVKGPNSQQPNTVTTCSLYLLVADRTGYRNLCRLLTDTKLRAPKGQGMATWEDFDGRTEGLICLAGGADGPIATALAAEKVVGLLGCWVVGGSEGRRSQPTANNPTTNNPIQRLQSLFPDRLYIDLQHHLDPEEERLNRALQAVAEQHRIPLVATNDVRHATQDGRRLLDVLTCLREHVTLDTAGRRLLANAERHLKSPREMAVLFRDRPDAIANTRRVAEQCGFTLADLGYRFPDYPLPPGATMNGHLRELTYAGARDRYGTITDKIRTQLEHELAVIAKLELAGYFLIVWDIVRFCRTAGILMQGRGSAANSAVCYALGITAVDAIGMELLFERFLSEERGEWPDIDIDLPSGDQRERVIQYVYQRYGPRGAAMTANVITYRTRSAVREVGKALGFAERQVDRLSKLLSRFEFRDDLDELAVQLKTGGVDPAAPRVRQLVDLVAQIQNLPRHLGQHSGGMVIAAGRLDEVVPLEPAAMPGRVVVQWDKDDCADLGIIKVDLLGLGMMAVLEEAIPLIKRHEGIDIDLAKLPANDPKTYAMLQRADTIGVFQVESRAQMATLPRLHPEHFYDLVVEVAIIRPGPIVGQMVHPFLARRRKRAPVTYPHPELKPILERTLGVPLFQEQLLRMAMAVANFTGGEAEELRRAMGFKRSMARMREIEERLRAGMAAKGITGATQDMIVKSITSFALYGFPESHAASFALLAYASAYLRAHHLAAFTCALLNNWPMGFYHPATLVKDAQRHGLRVLPIDIRKSEWRCSLDVVGLLGCWVVGSDTASPTTNNSPLALRLGLKYVGGLREEAAKRIEVARAEAPFMSIADVANRADLRDDEVQSLAHVGAFAPLGLTRREALWQAAAVPREPLLKIFIDKKKRLTDKNTTNVDGDASAIVSRLGSLAAGDGPGGEQLLPHQTASARGTLRLDEPDPARGVLDPSEHRRGQRSGDATRLRQLSAHCPGQPPRAGDLSSPGRQDPPSRSGGDCSDSEAIGFGGQTVEPFDPVPEQSSLITNQHPNNQQPNNPSCPLPEMSPVDRTLADYKTTGMTVGPHLMRFLREQLDAQGVLRARDLPQARNRQWQKVAGLVIVRQRPGSAKGFCFLTLEDETGLANAVVTPDMFQRHRAVIHTASLLLVEGPLQIQEGVVHLRARRFTPLQLPTKVITQTGGGYRMRVTPEDDVPALPKSHDFR